MVHARAAEIALALSTTLIACDPPCPTYWKLACDRCDDRGCEQARERAEQALGAAPLCEQETASFTRLVDRPGGKDFVCAARGDGPLPSDELLQTWSCGNTRVTLGLDNVVVDDRTFAVTSLSERLVGLKLTASQQTQCELERREDKLIVRCLSPVGSLPANEIVRCVSSSYTPTTCEPQHEGKTRCAPDHIRMLECRSGKLVVTQFCRGPKGCGKDDTFTSCDETLAKRGEPCTDTMGVSEPTDVDTKQPLTCKDAKWAPK